MRNLVIMTMTLAIAIITTGCEKNNGTIQTSLIKNTWIASYEENPPQDFLIYRPGDYKEILPARFRQVFDFKDHNNCDYLILAPSDAHYMTEGTWVYDDSDKIISILNPDSEVAHQFEVIELNENLLKLKRMK